jgi:ribosomal protein L40E
METKASENGGRGRNPEADKAEAGGRGRQSVELCANCGAQNHVDADWTWFTCWKCNLQKPMPLPGH